MMTIMMVLVVVATDNADVVVNDDDVNESCLSCVVVDDGDNYDD